MKDNKIPREKNALSVDPTDETGPRVLAIGGTVNHASEAVDDSGLIVASFAEISVEKLAEWQPDVVLSPLFGDGYDCFDLAELLVEAGFEGQYRAAIKHLPDPSVVRREVRATFPDLDFDLIQMESGTSDKAH